jgi:hypothetical protein
MKTIAVLALVSFAGAAQAAVLYSQAAHTPGAAGGNGLSAFQGVLSPGGPLNTLDREVADDFVVPAGPGWNITSIDSLWVPFNNTTAIPVTGGEIRFFQRTGTGGVGAQVGATINAASTVTSPGPVYFGRTARNINFNLGGGGVNLAPGQYFVQVQVVVNDNWFWLTAGAITGSPAHVQRGASAGAGADATWPASWQATGPGNAIFPTASDQAFTLNGDVIPAPGALALLGLGGLVAGRRRR